MGNNDMNHMQHLESVALSDCAVLQTKEATYQGSWKRAGGRSAWFMARRNMDRLITMMAAPKIPEYFDYDIKKIPAFTDKQFEFLHKAFMSEDVFLKIRANPKGEDGTVLACVRDLRRYFTLVEAEMIAEGVVEPETMGITLGDRHVEVYKPSGVDVYQAIADEKGLTREQVKQRVHKLFYSIPTHPPATPQFRSPREEAEARAEGGGHYAQERAEAVADGGSQHASQNPLFPWQATREEFEALCSKHGDLMSPFYTVRALGLYQLEPVVASRACAKELYPAYVYAGANKWIMRRAKVPFELEDNFPRLRLELNTKEWEGISEDHQPMYYQDTADLKWKIRAEFIDWGKE